MQRGDCRRGRANRLEILHQEIHAVIDRFASTRRAASNRRCFCPLRTIDIEDPPRSTYTSNGPGIRNSTARPPESVAIERSSSGR
jgi:hypothetical protein